MGIVFDKTSCYNATIKSSARTQGFLFFFHPRGTDAGLSIGFETPTARVRGGSNGDVYAVRSMQPG